MELARALLEHSALVSCKDHVQSSLQILVIALYLAISLRMEPRAQTDFDPKEFAELFPEGCHKQRSLIRGNVFNLEEHILRHNYS